MKAIGNLLTLALTVAIGYYLITVSHIDLAGIAKNLNSQVSSLSPSQQGVTPGVIQKLIRQLGQTPNFDSLTGVQSGSTTADNPPSTLADGALDVQGIIKDTNQERTNGGVVTLTESSQLDASAEAKANDLLARQYFEHTSPDGKTVSDLVVAQGYAYIKVGENLALGNFPDDQALVADWMNSPGHRANIMDPQFTQIGIGIAYGQYQGRTVYIAVQHFGRPRSACPNVDATIKSAYEAEQASAQAIESSLAQLKTQIDQGSAQGQDVSVLINLYNTGVQKYNSMYTELENLRTEYNAQVQAFNACLAGS